MAGYGIVQPMPDTPFAELLRETMEEEQVTIYGLARRYATQVVPSIRVETAERSIYKWLAGDHLPNSSSREALARALGRAPDFFDKGIDWELERLISRRVDGYFKRDPLTVIA
jgi:hypothetical protein